jgi:hypothetical protein
LSADRLQLQRQSAGSHGLKPLQGAPLSRHLRLCVKGSGAIMATLQQQIADKFLAKFAESKDVDAEKIEQLRRLLTNGKTLKAEEFVKIFSLPDGGDLK